MKLNPTYLISFTSRLIIFCVQFIISGCSKENPEPISFIERIEKVTIIFDGLDGNPPITATAEAPFDRGEDGPYIEVTSLQMFHDYILTFEIESLKGEDLDEEIRRNSRSFMIFFGWNYNRFNRPRGDGNIDNRLDDVNYEDFDDRIVPLPVGLVTSWKTHTGGLLLRTILKNQGGLKTTTSTASVGDTGFDLTWHIFVNN